MPGSVVNIARVVRSCAIVFGLLAALWVPQAAHGGAAAQKQTGSQKAKTLLSLGNVATDPALRQIQLTFDPRITPAITRSSPTTQPTALAIQSFQLDASYDASKLDIVSVDPIDGFSLGTSGTELSPGIITGITGFFGSFEFISELHPNAAPAVTGINTNTGDQNFFTITFQLKPGFALDTVLRFSFFAGAYDGSVVDALDPNNLEAGTFESNGPDDITPAFVTASVANGDLGANAGAVPLPKGAVAGALTLALAALVGIRLHRRAGKTV